MAALGCLAAEALGFLEQRLAGLDGRLGSSRQVLPSALLALPGRVDAAAMLLRGAVGAALLIDDVRTVRSPRLVSSAISRSEAPALCSLSTAAHCAVLAASCRPTFCLTT